MPATLEWADGYMLAGIADCHYVRYGNGFTLTFDRNDLQIPLGQQRYDRWGLYETTVFRRIIANLNTINSTENKFVEDVKKLLSMTSFTQRELANKLGVSVPTLQRKLAMAETSYRQLSQEERSKKLVMLLSTPDNLDIVAAEMGFSDRRSLTRACRAWLGMTPSKFRKLINNG